MMYDAREIDGRFDEKTRAAIMAYQTDWQLPITGRITRYLIAHLDRKHPATRPQWTPLGTSLGGSTCKVWNDAPAPREKLVWSGKCTDGLASGNGELIITYVVNGKAERDFYTGMFTRGKATGRGNPAPDSGPSDPLLLQLITNQT